MAQDPWGEPDASGEAGDRVPDGDFELKMNSNERDGDDDVSGESVLSDFVVDSLQGLLKPPLEDEVAFCRAEPGPNPRAGPVKAHDELEETEVNSSERDYDDGVSGGSVLGEFIVDSCGDAEEVALDNAVRREVDYASVDLANGEADEIEVNSSERFDDDGFSGLMQTLIAAILAGSRGEGPPVDLSLTQQYSEAVKTGYRRPFLEFTAARRVELG